MEPTWKPHEKHGRLTKQSDLPDTVFAFPKQRKEPLTDASHVRNSTRAAACTLAARAAGWRGDNALKALYLALAQQWLEIAIIGDAADQERAIEQLSDV